MCIKLVQTGHFNVNDGYPYLYLACFMRSLELTTELLKLEPTEKTLLENGGEGPPAYTLAIMYGRTDIANSIKQYANRRGYKYSLEN